MIYNSEIVKYDIYSLDGRLIHNGFKKKEIDLNNFSKGVYFLKIETTDGAFVRKNNFSIRLY
ncbi:MAG: T9SS type A sorting domain-containing protein [Bacteroidetes bacterium]|nr:T9SS type A sorting domain-containing protein [Bacteroidota bacterium]